MKQSRLLIVLIAVILFIGARVDAALSLEARAAIEEMRTRVNQNLQTIDNESDEGQYIPGRELKSVLDKYRVRVYGAPDATDEALAHWRVSVEEESQVASSDYKAGDMLATALNNYRTQRKVFSLVKVMKAKEVTAHNEQPSEEPARQVLDTPHDKQASVTSEKQPVTVSSSELLTQSKTALQDSIEEAPQSSVSRTATSLDTASETSTDDVDVQKYEFKMPRNYRILVK